MTNLFKAFLFKLKRDLTFRITLFVGVGLAFFMTLLYVALEHMLSSDGETIKIISGQSMLLQSLSPAQNFGIAIPVNLITFTVLEFTQGSIRNKIIAGNSKANIYISLCLNGLIFAFSLITVYILLCFGLGCIFGGFEPSGAAFDMTGSSAPLEAYYIPKILLIAALTYVCIVSVTIFFATLLRNIGPCIPIVIVGLVFLYLIASFGAIFGEVDETLLWVLRIANPLYGVSANEIKMVDMVVVEGEMYPVYERVITNETFICAICSNIGYAAAFFFGGLFIFKKRDVK